jgi:hypothetical protein
VDAAGRLITADFAEVSPLVSPASPSSALSGRHPEAIKELRQGPTPAVAIGRPEQVNVAERQANALVKDARHPD